MVGSKKCGHKKDLNQWQDIHIMLSALHEVLLRTCTTKYENKFKDEERNSKKFWEYVTLMQDTNTDEVSRLWAELLKILNIHGSILCNTIR